MPKICFVESDSYSVLDSKSQKLSTGGESVQHTLLAREFAKRGWQVSMICKDVGQPDGTIIDKIQVWKTYKQTDGLPYVRFLYPRLYSMWNALKNANADIYFQSCAGLMTGVAAKYVGQNNRKMIFRVAHDTDCVPGQQLITYRRDKYIYEYGLQSADLISVQSNTQAVALKENYGLDSVGVDMAAEIPDDVSNKPRDIDVLWVNNFRAFKRPEIVCEIAKAMPDVSFTMIGGPMRGCEDLFREVKEEAKRLENLHFVGAVPYSEVNAYFSRAKLFLNTSDSEGFPNSFLQAWVRGVPVVSFFDPDGFISSFGLGLSADAQDNFSEPLASLLQSEDQRWRIGERARQFVIDRYSSQAIVKQYEQLFEDRFAIGLKRD